MLKQLELKRKLYAERERLMKELMKPEVVNNLEIRRIYNQSLQAINDLIDVCVARNRF